MPKYVVAAVDEIRPGLRKIVEVGGRSIGVFNIDGSYYALRNSCPHQGGELCKGPVSSQLTSSAPGEYKYDAGRSLVRCPWHGWEFDVRTGQSWFDPRKLRVKSYEVSIASGNLISREAETDNLTQGPYVAETFPVSIEENYVVVELAS